MKIIYFIPSLAKPGGMQRVLIDKINFLVDKFDYNIIVVETEEMGNPFFNLSSKVKIVNLKLNFNEHYDFKLWGKIINHYKKLKLYKLAVQELVSSEEPDICISLAGKEVDFLYKIANAPTMIEIHFSMNIRQQFINARKSNLIWNFIGYIRTKQFVKSVMKYKHLVVLSEKDYNNWSKNHKNTHKIHNSNSLVAHKISDLKNKIAIAVGKLDPQKGYDLLINVWSKVSKKHPDWVLEIYGEGEWQERLNNQINLLRLKDKVILKGVAKNVDEVLCNSSMFLLSSRYEGFGMVLLEAASCGLPLISFDCDCGPSEIIKHGENGYLIKTFDLNEFADKINYLIENPLTLKSFSIKAKEYSANFEQSIIMDKWIKLFNDIIHEKNLTN